MKHLDYLELLTNPLAGGSGGGGSSPTGTVDIVANGTANVAAYADANVAVPGGLSGGVAYPAIPSTAIVIESDDFTAHDFGDRLITAEFGRSATSSKIKLDVFSTISVGDYVLMYETYNGQDYIVGGTVRTVNQYSTYGRVSFTLTMRALSTEFLTMSTSGYADVRGKNLVNFSGGGGSANDWAYAFISGGFSGVLTDSVDPTVPRITKVNRSSLYQATGLTGVYLPNCIEVDTDAFSYCTSLTSVSLPVCAHINGFQYCDAIETLSIPLCTEVKTYTLTQLKSLKELNLPKVRYISNSSIAGSANQGSQKNSIVKLVELPELIQNSGGITNFNAMTAVRIGSAVTSLTGNSFRYLPALDTVIFGKDLAAVPTMNNAYVFGGSPIRSGNGYVYVPDSLEAAWKTASQWSVIAAQIKPLSSIATWASGTYAVGDVVTYSGHYYRCDASTASTPWLGPWDTTLWQDLGAIY